MWAYPERCCATSQANRQLDDALQKRIVELAQLRRRFGYRRIGALLRREGCVANHKRVFRLYQEAGLAVRCRRKRQGVMVEREKLSLPTKPNEVWSMDFVSDALAGGRRIKALTIVDDFTKESVDISEERHRRFGRTKGQSSADGRLINGRIATACNSN